MTQPEQTPKPCPFCGATYKPHIRLVGWWDRETLDRGCPLKYDYQFIGPHELDTWNRRHFEVTEEMEDAAAKEIGERVFFTDSPSDAIMAERKEWSQGTCKQSAIVVLAAVKRIVEGEA